MRRRKTKPQEVAISSSHSAAPAADLASLPPPALIAGGGAAGKPNPHRSTRRGSRHRHTAAHRVARCDIPTLEFDFAYGYYEWRRSATDYGY